MLDGSPQRILTSVEPDPIPVSLLHVERRSTRGKIRAFAEFDTETLRKNAQLQGIDATATRASR